MDLNGSSEGTNTTLHYRESEPAAQITPAASLGDPGSLDVTTSTLTVSFQANGSTADQLIILATGTGAEAIGVDGDQVTYGGAAIGTFRGGMDGADLVIEFNSGSTPEAVQAVLRAIGYSNSSDDPSITPRELIFRIADVEGNWLAASAIIEVESDGVVLAQVVADGTDQAAIINWTLANSNSSVVMLPEGEFWVGTNIVIPDGKTLVGAGQGLTTIKILPDWDFALGNGAIYMKGDSRLADLSVDGNKVNLGGGAALRIHAVVPSGPEFLVENVSVKDATGYAFWAMSSNSAQLASGVFKNCYAENSNVLFETTNADGVLFENCVGADGDGDIWIESVFHPSANSNNITYSNSTYTGYAQVVNVLSIAGPQKNIVFSNVYGETTAHRVAVWIDGPDGNEVFFTNSTFISVTSNAANVYNSTIHATNTQFLGGFLGLYVHSGAAYLTDSEAAATISDLENDQWSLFSLYTGGDGAIFWEGGHLSATGQSATGAARGNVTISDSTTIVLSDAGKTDEATSTRINVTANDRDLLDGPPKVGWINGIAVAPADVVTLESGALVTLNDDGTLAYDPNGQFEWLGAGPSAANLSAIDHFTYTLGNGKSGTVVVRLSGLNGAPTLSVQVSVDGIEDRDVVFSAANGNAIIVGDEDSEVLNVTLSTENGTLRLSAATDLTVSGEGTGSIALSGSAAKINAALEGLIYRGNLNFEGDGRLVIVVGDDSDTDTETITISLADDGTIDGDSGSNSLSGSTDNDLFRLEQGGDDVVFGFAGNDSFYFGGAYTSADEVDAGEGGDSMILQGDYSGGATIGTIIGLASISLAPGNLDKFGDTAGNLYSYVLTATDASVHSGGFLKVNGFLLREGEDFTFDGSAETDGAFILFAGFGTDRLTGGAKNDFFLFGQDGRLGAGDSVVGGAGYDSFYLRGNYVIDFNAPGFTSAFSEIESITLASALDTQFFSGGGSEFDYSLTWNDALLALGGTITINGSRLLSNETMGFDGGSETDGRFRIFAGAGDDILSGGAGDDMVNGALGADVMAGAGGNDTFIYRSVMESTATSMDTILTFEAGDKIDLSSIDANTTASGNHAFTFIGDAAFSKTAGELRAIDNEGGSWTVEADVDGDGLADLVIAFSNTISPITAGDFYL